MHFAVATTVSPARLRQRPRRLPRRRLLAVPDNGVQFHTVQAGDTLADIAAMYGISLKDLRAVNGELFSARSGDVPYLTRQGSLRRQDLIYPNERLYLPLHAKQPIAPLRVPAETVAAKQADSAITTAAMHPQPAPQEPLLNRDVLFAAAFASAAGVAMILGKLAQRFVATEVRSNEQMPVAPTPDGDGRATVDICDLHSGHLQPYSAQSIDSSTSIVEVLGSKALDGNLAPALPALTGATGGAAELAHVESDAGVAATSQQSSNPLEPQPIQSGVSMLETDDDNANHVGGTDSSAHAWQGGSEDASEVARELVVLSAAEEAHNTPDATIDRLGAITASADGADSALDDVAEGAETVDVEVRAEEEAGSAAVASDENVAGNVHNAEAIDVPLCTDAAATPVSGFAVPRNSEDSFPEGAVSQLIEQGEKLFQDVNDDGEDAIAELEQQLRSLQDDNASAPFGIALQTVDLDLRSDDPLDAPAGRVLVGVTGGTVDLSDDSSGAQPSQGHAVDSLDQHANAALQAAPPASEEVEQEAASVVVQHDEGSMVESEPVTIVEAVRHDLAHRPSGHTTNGTHQDIPETASAVALQAPAPVSPSRNDNHTVATVQAAQTLAATQRVAGDFVATGMSAVQGTLSVGEAEVQKVVQAGRSSVQVLQHVALTGTDVVAKSIMFGISSSLSGSDDDEDGGPAKASRTAHRPAEPKPESLSRPAMKRRLLDTVYATGRGVVASADQRGLVEELTVALEAQNPTAVATQALSTLDGHWKLVYTNNRYALGFMEAVSVLPGMAVGDIFQVIDGQQLTAENRVQIAAPFMQPLHLTASTGFEVRTPRHFKVKFMKAGVNLHMATPEIFSSIEVPASVRIGTVDFDLRALQRMLKPVQDGMAGMQDLLNSSTRPEVSAQAIPAAFLMTTYVDADIRIARGADNTCFVFLRDVAIDQTE